ncbi:hypothetical protein BDF20DRAFT_820832, partial [Mycotypha africana]|uniref:uncharacterized protein n=1 Tax=Mycotypha africana TaxID=64632 RepID=UPI0023010221
KIQIANQEQLKDVCTIEMVFLESSSSLTKDESTLVEPKKWKNTRAIQLIRLLQSR